jgi:Uma2 family endonuclease
MPRTYPEVAPEMVMEVKSAFDRLIPIQKKIQSFLQLQWGIRVGILIDPDQRSVSVYRLGAAVNVLVYLVYLSHNIAVSSRDFLA